MKQNYKTYLVPSLSALIAIAPPIVFNIVVLPYYVGAALAGAGVLYLLCASVINCILTAKTKKRILKTPMSFWETEFKKRREEIHLGLTAERKKVNRLITKTVLYNISLFVAVFLINCGGVIIARAFVTFSEDFSGVEFSALAAAVCALLFVIFYVPFSYPLIGGQAKQNEQYFETPISESAFPLLYEIARKSAKAVDFTGAFVLYPNPDDGISVSEIYGVCAINLSPETVSLLTEDELYSVLVHEFAHAKHNDTKLSAKYRTAVSRYCQPQHMKTLFFGFFSYPAFLIEQKTDLLLQYSSILLENQADAEVKRLELGQTFMNATLKAYLYDEVFREPIEEFAFGVYAGETPPNDYYAAKVEYYKEHVEEKYPRAFEIIMRRLSAYNDSHPTFSMRAEAFGTSEFNPFSYPEGDYNVEVRAYCAQCDKELHAAFAAEWNEMRNEKYVQPKEIIERYEKDPEHATELLKLIALHAYSSVNNDKTLALAEKLLKEDEGDNSALFFKSMVLCMRDNEEGLPLLMQAMKTDYTIARDCFETYGTTVLRTGKQELLDQMREMRVAFGQEVFDQMKKHQKDFPKLAKNLKPCPDGEKRRKIIQSVEAAAQNNLLKDVYLAQSESADGTTRTLLFVTTSPLNSVQQKLANVLQLYFSLLWRKNEEYYVFRLPPNNRLWTKVKANAQKIV